MAITSGTIAPIQPASMHGGKSPKVLTLNVLAAQTIVAGHVLVALTNKASVSTGNVAATAKTVLGIAMEPMAAIATVSDSDRVKIALALPGTVWIGSMVTGATDDFQPTNHAAIVGVATPNDFVNVTYGGSTNQFACVATATATACINVFGYAIEQLKGKGLTIAAATAGGITNPRVYFTFTNGSLFFG